MNNLKKNKFIETNLFDYNKQPNIDIGKKNVESENYLIKNDLQTKIKSQLILKDTFDPYNYELNYNNTLRKDTKGEKEYIYYAAYDQGPGHGFGNLNVNNTIRLGEPSRMETSDFKMFRESEILDRFDFIDNRYAQSNNLVFPFPRSGELTRKSTYYNNELNLSQYNKYNLTNELHNKSTNELLKPNNNSSKNENSFIY
jgi:hypothetical protein